MNKVNELISCGEEFIKNLKLENSRNSSWEYCYSIFNEKHKVFYKLNDKEKDQCLDFLCLHLAFYLASWGMYRASSFLIYTNYKVHRKLVEEILKDEYNDLWNVNCEDYLVDNKGLLTKIDKLYEKIEEIYNEIREKVYNNNKRDKKIPKNKVTQTLVTKILLGTLGCTPAYDRFFVSAVKKCKISSGNFGEKSIKKLAQFYVDNAKDFNKLRKKVSDNFMYPQMKVLDMCFWQKGYDMEMEKNNENKKNS